MGEHSINYEKNRFPVLERSDNGDIIITDSRDDPRMTLVISEWAEKGNSSCLNGFAIMVGEEWMLINGDHNITSLFHNGNLVPSGLPADEMASAAERPLPVMESFEDVCILVSDTASLYKDTVVEKAARIWVVCSPHMMFVADYIVSRQPVRLDTSFFINNSGNGLTVNVYNQHRLVLRRSKEALKLFQALNYVDDKEAETTLVCKSVSAEQHGDLCEASRESAIYGWTCDQTGCVHQRIYTFMMDAEKEIKFWHMRQADEFIRLEAPDHENTLDFRFTKDGFYVRRNGRTRCWNCL